jgi:hypothetical protein
MKRIHVVLSPPRRVHDFCAFGKSVATHLSQDPLFSPPPAAIAALEAGVAALEETLVAVESRRFGAGAERKARQSDVLAALQDLRAYVQTLADTLPTNEAAMVAARAGMAVKDAKGPKRGGLTVEQGRTSGSAHAFAPAAKTRAGYEWQYAREGGAWVSVPFTVHADVELTGLAPGALYSLRARAVTANGPSDWLQTVTFRVA